MLFAELLIKLCEIRELDVSRAFDAACYIHRATVVNCPAAGL